MNTPINVKYPLEPSARISVEHFASSTSKREHEAQALSTRGFKTIVRRQIKATITAVLVSSSTSIFSGRYAVLTDPDIKHAYMDQGKEESLGQASSHVHSFNEKILKLGLFY